MSAGNPRATLPHDAVNKALRTIGALFEPGDVIEIRALHVGRTTHHAGNTYAGYFSFENDRAIASAIALVDGRAEGVYVVLNRINPALLARAQNQLQAKLKNTTSDADVIEWRWLYVDADPKRPAGISSTDEEHEAAIQRTHEIREYLDERGWPEPIHGDSGNGSHLLYRLPSLELTSAGSLVKRCLRALAERFSDTAVIVDESTATRARLCKLYGTLTRKGDSTQDRPHRRSAILEVPERIEAAPVDLLESLADEATPVERRNTPKHTLPNGRGFDIEQWIGQVGLDVIKGPEPYQGGRRWTLRNCPFNPEHDKPVIIELAGGALVFKCLHKSCSENNWKALRRRFEPNYTGSHKRASIDLDPPDGSPETAPGITDLAQLPSVFSIPAHLDWCVDGMIAHGSVTLICAESGTGKTWLGYYIAGCIAHGFPVLGRKVRASNVLYLDGENPIYVVQQRLADLGITDSPNLCVWGGWNISPPVRPDSPLVVEFAGKHKGLIIYDSLIEFHSGSEQSSTETRAFMRSFRTLANLGATVIVLHHTGKADTSKQYRGSSDIKAAVDTAYLLARKSEDVEALRDLSMRCFKARLAPPQHFGMEFKKGQGFAPCEAFMPVRTTTELITEILSSHPGSNQKEIVSLGREQGFTIRQITDCLKVGLWQRTPGPHNSTLYSLPESPDE